MNPRNLYIMQNRIHTGDFRTERYFLGDEKAKSKRNRRKRGRTAYCGLALVLLAALNSLLALKCAEGFQTPQMIGGGSKQKYDQRTSLSTSTNPLKLAGDETSSAESVSTSEIDRMDTDLMQQEDATSANFTTNQLLLNFNASGSIGSLLLQMQKKEAELKLLNKSASLLFSEDQALKLDATNTSTIVSKTIEDAEANSQKSDLFSWIRKQDGDSSIEGGAATGERSTIDDDIAMELDNSVSIRITNSVKDITILEPPELDRIKSRTGAAEKNELNANENDAGAEEKPSPQSAIDGETQLNLIDDSLPTLSKAEHYDGRIGRDIRHLAVSTASCIDSVEEWQLFCQQSTGGLEPLIECIRDGAKSIRKGNSSPTDIKSKGRFARNEEDFRVASSACKVLRDLCALSQDLAAVITDGILRANTAYNMTEEYSLMDDMCTILRQGDDLLDISNPSSEKNSRRKRQNPFRQRQNPENELEVSQSGKSKSSKWTMGFFRGRREARLRSKLHVTQLLLAMTIASDSAVDAIRSTEGLKDALIAHSSYASKERRRRWMRYPGEKLKSMWLAKRKNERKASSKSSETKEPKKKRRQPFLEAASLQNNLNGRIKGTANQVLAAIGHNEWVPKIPGQKGLRILCLDGGGSRGMTSVMAMNSMVEALGGMEVADCFDMVVGTSTGAIIAFLVGLNLETSEKAVERYDVLIEKIFTKSAFSTPLLLFTTASYDESTFMDVLTDILGDYTMLDSRANAAVPLVFAVTSKMSSNPTHVALFRNYNYNGGELPDPFLIRPDDARENLELALHDEGKNIRQNSYPKKKGSEAAPGTVTPENGSRHPVSFCSFRFFESPVLVHFNISHSAIFCVNTGLFSRTEKICTTCFYGCANCLQASFDGWRNVLRWRDCW